MESVNSLLDEAEQSEIWKTHDEDIVVSEAIGQDGAGAPDYGIPYSDGAIDDVPHIDEGEVPGAPLDGELL